MPSRASEISSFSGRAACVLERIEHRCALTTEDEERVYRLRYMAYSQPSRIHAFSEGRLYDEDYDNSPNHYKIMTFLDTEFVSTFRIHVELRQTRCFAITGVVRRCLAAYT